MRKKEDSFRFSRHSLDRALERMLGEEKPFTKHQHKEIKKLITKSMTWNDLSCKWVLDDYKLEFYIQDDMVVSIIPYKNKAEENYMGSKPVTDFQKQYSKKYCRLGRTRNGKNKDKKRG